MKIKGFSITKFLIMVFLLVSIVLPLIQVFLNISVSDIADVIQAPQFGSMIRHSLVATLSATLISVAIAWGLHGLYRPLVLYAFQNGKPCKERLFGTLRG